ncbi:hypothetical protein Atai01_29840 [Amycolatopsis taiwanensis]|uniref:Uncharacterized protein n=1 Tax=Amycolatopsis taiwanensis TaxID=342230 RepID=A0A9W6VF25_9PSEU|nr:hypothetical protein Atai01_29840 [Amycolatopsis taiwanensis]
MGFRLDEATGELTVTTPTERTHTTWFWRSCRNPELVTNPELTSPAPELTHLNPELALLNPELALPSRGHAAPGVSPVQAPEFPVQAPEFPVQAPEFPVQAGVSPVQALEFRLGNNRYRRQDYPGNVARQAAGTVTPPDGATNSCPEPGTRAPELGTRRPEAGTQRPGAGTQRRRHRLSTRWRRAA